MAAKSSAADLGELQIQSLLIKIKTTAEQLFWSQPLFSKLSLDSLEWHVAELIRREIRGLTASLALTILPNKWALQAQDNGNLATPQTPEEDFFFNYFGKNQIP